MANSVEVAITHQIRIGREDAWVKVGVHLDYDPDLPSYTIEDQVDRATRIVNNKVIDAIEETVATVNIYEGKK
jgi:hypothetical protein